MHLTSVLAFLLPEVVPFEGCNNLSSGEWTTLHSANFVRIVLRNGWLGGSLPTCKKYKQKASPQILYLDQEKLISRSSVVTLFGLQTFCPDFLRILCYRLNTHCMTTHTENKMWFFLIFGCLCGTHDWVLITTQPCSETAQFFRLEQKWRRTFCLADNSGFPQDRVHCPIAGWQQWLMNAVSQAKKKKKGKLHQAQESVHKDVKGVGQSDNSIVGQQDKSFHELETFRVVFHFCCQKIVYG